MVAVRGGIALLVVLLWATGTLFTAAGTSRDAQRADRIGTLALPAPACATVTPVEDELEDQATAAAGVVAFVPPMILADAGASRRAAGSAGVGTSGWLAGCPRGPPSVT